MASAVGFELGTTSLTRERQVDELPADGIVPAWFSGQLLRVGPACFEVGDDCYNHWFDGLSMLHRFGFDNGRVSYCNRFLRSQTWQDNTAANAIRHGEFATSARTSWAARLKSLVSPDLSDNANVAIAPLAGQMTALTETPTPLAFDPETLATLGPVTYADEIPATVTTAHPHFDFAGQEALNFTTAFGRHTQYHIYRLPAGGQRRELISSVPVKRPGYMHSFAATPRYIVLTEWPLTVNPLRLAVSGITGTPFIDNYRWQPGQESRLLVIERATGKLVREVAGPAGFAFHQCNAWEDGDTIVLELCIYEDASIIDKLRLSAMRNPETAYPQARLTRIRIGPRGSVSVTAPVDIGLELPGIDYRRCNMRPNRIVYGVAAGQESGLLGGLVRVDTADGTVRRWQQPHCYPGEPVFTPEPDSEAERDGVVMSLVLDGKAGHSFLLLLDAVSFDELARVHLPHPVPFGFHGLFLQQARAGQ